MARFCAYIEKIFGLGSQLGKLTDARTSPQIPTAAASDLLICNKAACVA